MIVAYPVIFTKTNDDKDTYLIEIPDIKGMTQGYGLADAIKMAKDYIECYIHDRSEIPKASSISNIDISQGKFFSEGDSELGTIEIDL